MVQASSTVALAHISSAALDDTSRRNAEGQAEAPQSATSRDVHAACTHDVHLYENDDELCELISDFVLEGFEADCPVVVIATPEHVASVRELLAVAGVDLGRVGARLRFFDARELLSRFMLGARPDWTLFKAHVAALLRSPDGELPPHTFAYGEMVDLLWQQGNQAGAVHLEEMWNQLQGSVSFSLLCAYSMGSFYRAPGELAEVCRTHRGVRGRERREARAPASSSAAFELQAREQQSLVERALRAALRTLTAHDGARGETERALRSITDALPVLLSYIDAGCRYRFVNQAYTRWFGVAADAIIGQHMEQILGQAAFELLRPHVDAALSGKTVTVQLRVPYSTGERYIDAKYIPQLGAEGQVSGFVALVTDVTEQKRHEEARHATARRNERLMKVTAAIAAALDEEQVFQAVVDHVATALEASSAGLWLVESDQERAKLVRSLGYSEAARRQISSVPLDRDGVLPVTDALRTSAPVWIASQADLLRRYPHLAPVVSADRAYGVACLPLIFEGKARGALGLTFDDRRIEDKDERNFLLLVARYSAQAVERLRLLTEERALRAHAESLRQQNEQARVRAELLYELAGEVIRARSVEEVFAAALAGIERALGASRCSILVFDEDGVMRFRAWRGLSDEYRRTVEGHSPWSRDAAQPQPIVVPDVGHDPNLVAYRELFRSEGIGALGFIPLVWQGSLIGKFMVYYPAPRRLSDPELEMAKAIANHLATALGRFSTLRELEQTVHFNEIFTGMLGHDLRNPLGAIMAAAQIAERRTNEGDAIRRPLTRILSSGARMAKMIDQLLDFTRVRVGQGIPIDARHGDLLPIVRQAIDEVSVAHPAWQIQLSEDGGDTFGMWDADRISQVFSNLVANAVQHGELEHGVHLRVDARQSHSVSVEVHNRGVIPQGILPHLFEPMAGGDRRREKSRGLGLGLYISREILKAHGGSIEVSSTEADGTTFTVLLPRVLAAVKSRAPIR